MSDSVETTENKNQSVEAKAVKGFVGAQPGKFPIKSKVLMTKTAGEKGTFVHDQEVVFQIADTLGDRLHPTEERLSTVPLDYEDYVDLIRRMVCMLMARKLSNSLTDGFDEAIAAQLKRIASAPCYGPSPLVLLIDHFGRIEEKDLQYRMVGQALLAFSYFGRAVIQELQDRERTLFVNTRWVGHKEMLFDYCIGHINAWAESAPLHDFNFQGAITRMTVPKVFNGLGPYAVLINTVPRDERTNQIIQIAGTLEPYLGMNFDQAGLNALGALGVQFVDWSSADIANQEQVYSRQVETKIRNSLSASTNWVKVAVMKTSGSPAQLLSVSTQHQYFCHHDIGAQALELGWMFAGRNNCVVPNSHAFNLVPPETKRQGILTYVEGMLKHNF